MERVEDAGQNIEVFENDIELHLQMFCEEHEIDDMSNESQNRWDAALMYIQKHVFSDPMCLKAKTPYAEYLNNNYDNQDYRRGLNKSTCGRYDYDLVSDIADYYIYISMFYNKKISLISFSNLTGISYKTLNKWEHGEKLSVTARDIAQKIKLYGEASVENNAFSSKGNPVANLAILNRWYGWANKENAGIQNQKPSLSDTQLPDLRQKMARIEGDIPDIVVSE